MLTFLNCTVPLEKHTSILRNLKSTESTYKISDMISGVRLPWAHHGNKTRVQMPAKMLPAKMLLFMGPTLGFDTKQRNIFFDQIWCTYNINNILTILFIVKYETITPFYEFFLCCWAHNQQFFACSNEEKMGACSSPISLG